MEYTEDQGLNLYEMDVRKYDPAIARWTSIDPVTHHSLSPYNAFDNNPVFYADPSGADSWSHLGGSTYQNNDTGAVTQDWGMAVSETSAQYGDAFEAFNIGDYFEPIQGSDNNKEGQTRQVAGPQLGVDGPLGSVKQYYHAGGLGEARWYSEGDYFELYRTTIRAIGQGQASFESLNDYGFTEDVLAAMTGWAIQAYSTYKGRTLPATGNIKAMGFDSPIFMLASLRAVGALFLRTGASSIAIKGSECFCQKHGFHSS